MQIFSQAQIQNPADAHTASLAPTHEPFISTDGVKTLRLENDCDINAIDLQGVERIELQFPKFTDGRAYTQAVMLRRRKGFKSEIRALGDVLVDQVLQMQRTGFTSAVLRADQNLDVAKATLQRFKAFYQGDAVEGQPHFSRS
jgi:uncharacterized protein (DUF934 family)